MAAALCPHCSSRMGFSTPGPATTARCPACRLIVAAGRAVDAGQVEAHGRSSAAGAALNAARRHAADPIDPDAVTEAIRACARELGVAPQRLRMLDYQDRCVGSTRPTLAQIVATSGSWKAACRRSADDSAAA